MDDYEPLDLETVLDFLEKVRNGDSFEPHTVHGIIDRAKMVTSWRAPSSSPFVPVPSSASKATHFPHFTGTLPPTKRGEAGRTLPDQKGAHRHCHDTLSYYIA